MEHAVLLQLDPVDATDVAKLAGEGAGLAAVAAVVDFLVPLQGILLGKRFAAHGTIKDFLVQYVLGFVEFHFPGRVQKYPTNAAQVNRGAFVFRLT